METADTLPVPEGAIQVLPKDLLVESQSSIWLATWMGHAQIMHYDGKTWNLSLNLAGGIDCLTRDNSNKICAGGYSNKINLGYYDGTSWTRTDDMEITREIFDMTKDPNGNIWACGRNGVVLKYDGKKWSSVEIKVGYISKYPDASYLLKSVEYYNGKIYALGSIFDFNRGRNIYYFFAGDINNWEIKDSMVIESPSSIIKWGYSGLYLNKSNVLLSYGLTGIWKLEKKSWEKLKDVEGTLYGISDINDNYILTVGDFQKILFYDGTNWENIADLFHLKVQNFTLSNVWTNGYETFIIGYGNVGGYLGTIIFHGK